MTNAQESVFVGMTDYVGCERVLMVRRQHDHKWWLPGGAIPSIGSATGHAGIWVKDLFVRETIELHHEHVATWKLTNGSHVFLVTPSTHGMTSLDQVRVHNDAQNKHITCAAPMSSEDIYHHLYDVGDMPWGQAKMALWAMYTQSLTSIHGRQLGAPLKDDVGRFNGETWVRPG